MVTEPVERNSAVAEHAALGHDASAGHPADVAVADEDEPTAWGAAAASAGLGAGAEPFGEQGRVDACHRVVEVRCHGTTSVPMGMAVVQGSRAVGPGPVSRQ